MRRFVRTAGIATIGAAALALWASSAHAQMANPVSPVEPKAVSPTEQPGMFIPTGQASTTTPPTQPAPEQEVVVPASEPVTVPEADPVSETAPAPAVELPAAAPPVPASAAMRALAEPRSQPVLATPAPEPSVVVSAGPIERAKSVLSGLAAACKIGVALPTGGPVLAFAVLAAAIVLDGQRFQRTRWLWDEDAPELLYAGDVIAPG